MRNGFGASDLANFRRTSITKYPIDWETGDRTGVPVARGVDTMGKNGEKYEDGQEAMDDVDIVHDYRPRQNFVSTR